MGRIWRFGALAAFLALFSRGDRGRSVLEAGATATTEVGATAATEAGATAATDRLLRAYGMTRDTLLYRISPVERVGLDTLTVAGNPDSTAIVADYYEPSRPATSLMPVPAGRLPAALGEYRLARASELGPALNVALEDPSAYARLDPVKIGVRVGDVLDRGGRIYPDVGSGVPSIEPFIVTFGGELPIRHLGRPDSTFPFPEAAKARIKELARDPGWRREGTGVTQLVQERGIAEALDEAR